MSSPPILTPNDEPLRFACLQCGECCRAWTIPVEVSHAKRHFEGVPWIEELSRARREDGTGRLLPPLGRSGRCHLNTSVGATLDCVFLGADSLCALHSRIEPEAKPSPCRQFPLHFVRTQRGIEAFLDPACKAVSAGSGPEITPAELADYAATGTVEELPEQLERLPGHPIDRAEYERLRERLRQILRQDTKVHERALQAFHELRTGSSSPVPLRDLRPDLLGRRLTLTLLLLIFRNAWDRKAHKGQGLGVALRRAGRMLRLAFGLLLGGGSVPIEARGIVVPAGVIDDLPWDPDSPAVRPALDRYLAGFADRHELAPQVARGVGLLLANLLLISWFARAMAWARSPESPGVVRSEDVVEAIQLTEKFGGSRMLRQVLDEGLLGDALRSLLEGPSFDRYVLGLKP